MTLAIATIEQGTVFIQADILLSYDLQLEGTNQPNSGLKVFFVNQSVAAAYSGTSKTAHNILRQAVNSLPADCSAASVADLLRSHCKQHRDVEFLLASATNPIAIYKIKHDFYSSSASGTFWIGDSEAANAVLAGNVCDPFQLAKKFQLLLDSRKHSTVGGLVTSAFSREGKFKFIPTMALASPFYIQRPGGWHSVDWGDAGQGGFGYTTLSPSQSGKNGWGVHFFQGNLGYFFRVNLADGIFEKLTWNGSLDSALDQLQIHLGFEVEFCGRLGG